MSDDLKKDIIEAEKAAKMHRQSKASPNTTDLQFPEPVFEQFSLKDSLKFPKPDYRQDGQEEQ